jgi:hypothetical protein
MKLKEFKKVNKKWKSWINEEYDQYDAMADERAARADATQDYASGLGDEMASKLAQQAVDIVGKPDGAAIENEIHTMMDDMPNPPSEDERWEIADRALSIAGEILGVGPDVLQEVRLSSYWKKRAAMRARKGRREYPNKSDREWARSQQKRSTAVQSAMSALHPQSTAAIEEDVEEEDINEKFANEFSEA